MWKKKVAAFGLAGCIVAGTISSGILNMRTVSASTFSNTFYDYDSKTDGDYKNTELREKNYSGSNLPHGYVYAIAADGKDSSVMVRKMTKAGNGADCSKGYVTIPRLAHTNIRNNFNASNDRSVRLRVRTNSNSGTTRGYWSPDSSQEYSNVVG